jgi:A/G-specific adenine glycosylase
VKKLSLRDPAGFRAALLAWYDRHGRKLPWRSKRPVPYRVWVSEIMLQQTRVAAVLGYYTRFLNRFPTVDALADASEAEVLAAWSGLGYYRRARLMYAAAKKLVSEHNGRFPNTIDGLRELPGVGRYTAAAIASICFREATAVVDGNVERVLLRLTGRPEPDPPEYWQLANRLLAADRPGDFNQSVMELGALVCTPKKPRCGECPVYNWCSTRGEHPTKAASARRDGILRYALVRRNGGFRLVQRGADSSLMARMWELPAADVNGSKPLLQLRHSITTTDYQVFVFPGKNIRHGCWVPVEQLSSLALTGVTRKILRKLGAIS